MYVKLVFMLHMVSAACVGMASALKKRANVDALAGGDPTPVSGPLTLTRLDEAGSGRLTKCFYWAAAFTAPTPGPARQAGAWQAARHKR